MRYTYLGRLELPSYLSIDIRTEDDTKHVYILSTIHVTKERKVSYSYSTEFSDEYILNDPQLFRTIANMYGLKIKTVLE